MSQTVKLKIHRRLNSDEVRLVECATSTVLFLNDNNNTRRESFFINSFCSDKNFKLSIEAYSSHTHKHSVVWHIEIRNHFLFFERKICYCLQFCLGAYTANGFLCSCQSVFSLSFSPFVRSFALSMQTKIKWNNLVFLMFICYLAADGLIHHANMNALPYIHKFLLRNIKLYFSSDIGC